MIIDVKFRDDNKKNITCEMTRTIGIKGENGASAYEIAVAHGFKGTESEWLESLKVGGSGNSNLPIVDEKDDGKVLMVVDGKWTASELPMYDGAYFVTPSTISEQTLHTAKMFMDGDVMVAKIPYAEVSNGANGTTVTIGSEV